MTATVFSEDVNSVNDSHPLNDSLSQLEEINNRINNLSNNERVELINFLDREYIEIASRGDLIMRRFIEKLETDIQNDANFDIPNLTSLDRYSQGVFGTFHYSIINWNSGDAPDPLWWD